MSARRNGTGRTARRGFTLLELIVVITIIGILGTFVLVRIAGSTDSARIAKANSDLSAIRSAATMYQAQTGSWPQSIQELVNPRDDNGIPIPGTLEKLPKDPWGNEYVFEAGQYGPIVTCYGRDNAPGGEGIDGDVVLGEEENEY